MNTCLKCRNILDIGAEVIYGLHACCFVESFGLAPTEFKDVDPKKSSFMRSNHEIQKQKNTFFHGNYLKYSARLAQTDYILKVQEPRFPELPCVEYLCNRIALLLKINVPAFHLINFNGRITFVTRNFMQDYIGTLHHLYKFLPIGEDSYSCEKIIEVILGETGKLADAAHFIEICLFDTLVGNNDRHGRNLGIIETASTKKLAPMYDNPSCLGIEEDFFLVADANPSGSIWTSTSKEPKTLDYIAEFKCLGYESVVTQFCKKVASQKKHIIDTIINSDLSDIRKTALIKLLDKRIGDFING